MRIQITAGGIYGDKGEEMKIGTILTLDERPTGWEGRFIVLGDQGENVDLVTGLGGGEGGEGGEGNPDFVYEAKETSPGWWTVLGPDGEELKKLRTDDAKAFNEMPAADRAEFLKGEA